MWSLWTSFNLKLCFYNVSTCIGSAVPCFQRRAGFLDGHSHVWTKAEGRASPRWRELKQKWTATRCRNVLSFSQAVCKMWAWPCTNFYFSRNSSPVCYRTQTQLLPVTKLFMIKPNTNLTKIKRKCSFKLDKHVVLLLKGIQTSF